MKKIIKNLELNETECEHDFITKFGVSECQNCGMEEFPDEKRKFDIKLLDDSLSWVKWLEQSKSHGLNEASQSDAIRDIYTKINEIVKSLNAL